MQNTYQNKHRQLINAAGGIVEDIFVLKTGVLLTKKSQITADAQQLFEQMNIDTNRPSYEQHAEFNSRITYLSFKDTPQDASDYNYKMIHEYGHRGVYNDEYVTFLIAGCAIETAMEFIAHNEATIARLTSSKTKAQNTPLFKLLQSEPTKDFIPKQRKIIQNFLTLRQEYASSSIRKAPLKNEIFNILAPASKVISFTITMSIKHWHKTLIGRLSHHGVETDMQIILHDIAEQLRQHYPIFFNTIAEYYAMGNSKKYEEN